MQEIKVIIGASYGDEGKGLATDFFSARAAHRHTMAQGSIPAPGYNLSPGCLPSPKGILPPGAGRLPADIINVLTNGGPQRGHTVEMADGRRHVFKHFGAASLRGAASYFDRQFMVNPMEFNREFEEFSAVHTTPEAYMHPECRFTTPWDMLVNQMLLKERGLHNSCGFGIWETVLRYKRGWGIPFSTFFNMDRDDRIAYLRQIRDRYCAERIREIENTAQRPDPANVEINDDTIGADSFFFSEDLLFHFEEDCERMHRLCPVRDERFLKCFPTVIFENAQGLLLDGNSKKEQDFTTPSTTGISRVFQTVESVFEGAEVEVCYVTRSYLTRHGDGTLENEVAAEHLTERLPGLQTDMTNVENACQGGLRYGMMDTVSLADRIRADFSRCGNAARNRFRPSVMVTHLNEHAGIDTAELAEQFGTLYLSDGRTEANVMTWRRAAVR